MEFPIAIQNYAVSATRTNGLEVGGVEFLEGPGGCHFTKQEAELPPNIEVDKTRSTIIFQGTDIRSPILSGVILPKGMEGKLFYHQGFYDYRLFDYSVRRPLKFRFRTVGNQEIAEIRRERPNDSYMRIRLKVRPIKPTK